MISKQLKVDTWDKGLCTDLVNVVNYYLSKGPLESVIEGAQDTVLFLISKLSHDSTAAYRQQLGGIFTSHTQLFDIPGISMDILEQLAHHIQGLNLTKLNDLIPITTRNNHVEAYVNGPDSLKVLLDEIHHAERYIHLSVMLFYNDQAGNLITSALLEALARGVSVRLMIDVTVSAIGYERKKGVGDIASICKQLEAAGGKVLSTSNPRYSDKSWPERRAELAAEGVPECHLFLQDYVQAHVPVGLNVVNHRKFMIIDGATAVIGSINIGDQYLYDTPLQTPSTEPATIGPKLGVPSDPEQWHDGCMRIKGEVAPILNRLFASQWIMLGGDLFEPSDNTYQPQEDIRFGEDECTVFTSFPGNPINLIQQYHLSLIRHISDETILVNPYMIDDVIWEEVSKLGEEQARHLKLCNSLHLNDHPTNLAAIRSHMYSPHLNGVKLYDYSLTERFSHWKISYDKRSDCVFHGSYNLNDRSAFHDFELGLLVRSKPLANKVRQMIEYDLTVSEQISDSKAFFKHPHLHPSTYLNQLTAYFT